MTGTVKSYEIKKNRDGSNNVLMLNVEISGPDDIQSVEYMSHAGDNHIPEIGSIVTILQAGKSWKIAIASNDQSDFDNTLNESERIIYANGGAYVRWNDDGTIELAGNTDTAVSYSDLNAALQAFLTDLNAKLVIAFATVPYTWPGTSVDISAAEVTEVKLP